MFGKPRKLGGEVDGVLAHHGVQLPVNLQAFSKSVDHWYWICYQNIVDIIDIEHMNHRDTSIFPDLSLDNTKSQLNLPFELPTWTRGGNDGALTRKCQEHLSCQAVVASASVDWH